MIPLLSLGSLTARLARALVIQMRRGKKEEIVYMVLTMMLRPTYCLLCAAVSIVVLPPMEAMSTRGTATRATTAARTNNERGNDDRVAEGVVTATATATATEETTTTMSTAKTIREGGGSSPSLVGCHRANHRASSGQ